MRHRMPWLSFLRITAVAWFFATGAFDGGGWLPSAFADSPERLPPRPERTADERKTRAEELRRIYSGDPATWPAPHVDDGVAWKEIGLLPEVEHPADNPHTDAKETLGKTLFFDPRLSGSGQIACASCHDPDLAWADGRTTSFGHSRKHLARNAPTIRNTAFQTHLFWDGRAESLEDQARQVLLNPDEMRSGPEHVVALLEKEPGYQELWQKAFGAEPVSIDRAAQALACFERTVVGGSSRFDSFMRGGAAALTDEALLGMDLFRREARCINCHNGPAFSDGGFHDIGLSNYGRPFEDLGRGRITNDPADTGKFRTPSLRDATATLPLMHNGLFELQVALTLYNAGMPTPVRRESQADDPRFPVKSPLVKPLGLNKQDLADLTAFLTSLEETKRRIRPPVIPGL
jgi:cytochrome c peroxidase